MKTERELKERLEKKAKDLELAKSKQTGDVYSSGNQLVAKVEKKAKVPIWDNKRQTVVMGYRRERTFEAEDTAKVPELDEDIAVGEILEAGGFSGRLEEESKDSSESEKEIDFNLNSEEEKVVRPLSRVWVRSAGDGWSVERESDEDMGESEFSFFSEDYTEESSDETEATFFKGFNRFSERGYVKESVKLSPLEKKAKAEKGVKVKRLSSKGYGNVFLKNRDFKPLLIGSRIISARSDKASIKSNALKFSFDFCIKFAEIILKREVYRGGLVPLKPMQAEVCYLPEPRINIPWYFD